MKKYLMLLLLLISINTFSQKTNVAIDGVSVFKIGDAVTQINAYGYSFDELFIDNDYNFSDKNQYIDSCKNFCHNARVFHCDKVQVAEFEFKQGATLIYFNDKLIDIKLHDILSPDSKISDILKLKYGLSYGKIFLAGYNYNIQKYIAKGVKITPEIDKELQGLYLSSIYWTSGNITISVGGSNKTYDFIGKKYKSANQADGGISVTNNQEYEKLIACSNLDYQKKVTEYLNKLKQKSSSF